MFLYFNFCFLKISFTLLSFSSYIPFTFRFLFLQDELYNLQFLDKIFVIIYDDAPKRNYLLLNIQSIRL